jgi:uncharacterized protein with HEPN domain
MSKGSRDLDYLDHIADRIRRIERVTAGVDLAGFLGNEDLQALIERHIEVIGEAAGKLSQQARDLASDVIGARNVIIHGYAEIDPKRIWGMVKDHVPALHTAIDRLQRALRLARNDADHSRGGGPDKDRDR